MNHMEIAKAAAEAAGDKKADRMVLMDLKGLSDICDYQFICSGANERQTAAIASSIEDALRVKFNIKPSAIEGKGNGHWILMDYGSTNIHIFYDYLRDYYALESIWTSAKTIDLNS